MEILYMISNVLEKFSIIVFIYFVKNAGRIRMK